MGGIVDARKEGRFDAERCIEHFEAAWRHGGRPAIEAALNDVDGNSSVRAWVLIELIKVDLEYRWKNAPNIGTRVEDYLRRFPQAAHDSATLADLVGEEYRSRRRWGDCPSASELALRFPHLASSLAALLPRIDAEIDREIEETDSAPATDPWAPPNLPDSGLPVFSYRSLVLQQFVGSGGMGKVYRACHRDSGRTLAVKMLKKSLRRDTMAVERLIDEARVIGRFRHPGIVTIEGLGSTPGGGIFLVLEWIDGSDLSRFMLPGPVPVQQAVHWTIQAAEAVEHAHQQGIVHCDLKPANLLLRSNLDIVVSDFGLARAASIGSANLAPLEGTASFMAPEQIDGSFGPITPRTDVYGLGAVLYTLLTGQPPYCGKTAIDIIAQALSASSPPRPDELRSEIPTKLIEICTRCLARQPSDRIASAEEVANAIRE
jgi:hypothetical protein